MHLTAQTANRHSRTPHRTRTGTHRTLRTHRTRTATLRTRTHRTRTHRRTRTTRAHTRTVHTHTRSCGPSVVRSSITVTPRCHEMPPLSYTTVVARRRTSAVSPAPLDSARRPEHSRRALEQRACGSCTACAPSSTVHTLICAAMRGQHAPRVIRACPRSHVHMSAARSAACLRQRRPISPRGGTLSTDLD